MEWTLTIQVFASVIAILIAVTSAAFWFHRHYQKLAAPTEEMRDSIADPSGKRGGKAYITRAELLEEIRKKGCVETCPAIPVLKSVVIQGNEEIQEEIKEFIRDSVAQREESLKTLKAIFDRLSSVLGTMEMITGKLLDVILEKRKTNGA